MKKAAVQAAGILVGMAVLLGIYEGNPAAETRAEAREESAMDESFPALPGTRIAVVSKATNGEFWDEVRRGMEAAVSQVNESHEYKKNDQITMTFEGPANEQDVETQINTLDAVISENPDALCISVGDMESCQAQMEAARENGIPVIVFDSSVKDENLITAFRGTDNVLVGEIAADHLSEAMGGGGKAAVFAMQKKTQSSLDRTTGFVNAIPEGIEIVEILYADEVEDMEASMGQVLEEHPDLGGIFCSNADVAEIYLKLEKSESFSAVMVGVDATSRQVKAIRDGLEMGVVSQDAYSMGYETIIAAIQSVVPEETREPIEKSVLLEPAWLDEANLDSGSYDNYIYGE